VWWARALVVALWLGACTPAPSWDPSDRLEATYGAQRYTPAATGVPYVDGATAPVLDVYLPVAGGNRGVIVFVHGGGFTSGSRGDLFTWSGPLSHALEHGWALVNIEYRLEAWPAAVEDLDAALRWVDGDGVSVWGLNPEHVVVAGHSAGATIAAVHALHDGGEVAVDTELGELRRVDGWVSLAGILDLDHPSGTGARRAWQAPSARAASPAAVVCLCNEQLFHPGLKFVRQYELHRDHLAGPHRARYWLRGQCEHFQLPPHLDAQMRLGQ